MEAATFPGYHIWEIKKRFRVVKQNVLWVVKQNVNILYRPAPVETKKKSRKRKHYAAI